MSVNSKMTAIANPIRTLTGASGALTLDQMAKELMDANEDVSAAFAKIEEKGVTVPSGTKINGMAALIGSIQAGGGSGGDSEAENGLLDGTLVSYENSTATSIRINAFYKQTNLQVISCSAVEHIGSNAFNGCTSLSAINFPSVKEIGIYAFSSCVNLVSIDAPSVLKIFSSAFNGCSKLTDINFPFVEAIHSAAFYNCHSLANISLPSLAYIHSEAFRTCGGLKSVYLPNGYEFGRYVFANCSALETVILPNVRIIGSSAFLNCSKLSGVFIGKSSVATLYGSNAFSGTAIAKGEGWIYVPASLLTSYQKATNWTYYSSRFSAIEDMPT